MKNYLSSSNNLGKLMILIGGLVAVPLIVIPFYPQDIIYAKAFIIPSLLAIVIGLIMCKFSGAEKNNGYWKYTMQNGSLTVLFSWVLGFFIGAIPFVIAGQLNFIQALFESVSGWTTTGLSVVDVTVTPHIFLFHRGFMQFCGGLGFVMVMIIFIQGKQSMNLYNAEGHPDKLVPNLGRTARTIFVIYFTFLVIGTIVYTALGMAFFDSVIHTMCALSTGGFSNKENSIGEYNSLPIEAVTIVLMLIGTTNFGVLLLLVKRKIKHLLKISEIRFLFTLIVIMVPIVAGSLFVGVYMNIGQSLRVSLFNIVSALSTTGFSTVSYNDWPQFSQGIMIVFMLIGGGIGSTAGGIKLTRVYLMLRMTKENIYKRISPARHVSKPYYYRAQGKTFIDRTAETDTTGFISAYFIIFIVGTLLMTLTANCTLTEGMFEFASTLGTVGLSVGVTSSELSAATLIVQMFGMMLGRLEIFIVIIGVYSGISKIRQHFHKGMNELVNEKLIKH